MLKNSIKTVKLCDFVKVEISIVTDKMRDPKKTYKTYYKINNSIARYQCKMLKISWKHNQNIDCDAVTNGKYVIL